MFYSPFCDIEQNKKAVKLVIAEKYRFIVHGY